MHYNRLCFRHEPEPRKGIAPDPILTGMTRMKVFYRKVELTAMKQENRKFGGCLPGKMLSVPFPTNIV
jgi:hypothetical protein